MAANKLYTLTDEHRAQLKPWADKWIANALRTAPQTADDKEKIIQAMRGLYRSTELPVPSREVFSPSPLSGAIAATVASVACWLRSNPTAHQDLFSRTLTEREILAGAHTAVLVAVTSGQAVLEENQKAISLTGVLAQPAAGLQKTDAATAALQVLAQAIGAEVSEVSRDTALVEFYLKALSNWTRLHDGGNQWSGWVAYISFFRHVAKLDIDYSKWTFYEDAAIYGGPRFMHSDFWVVSDFPEVICRDDNNQPHSAAGPAIAWSDGWKLYYWHGTRVPAAWIESPKTLNPQEALKNSNVELRRCAAEIVGWDRILDELNPKVINVDPDPQIGTLVEVMIEDEPERFLKVKCGTGRTFALPVPPEMKTALEANAWTYALDGDVLKKLEVRT